MRLVRSRRHQESSRCEGLSRVCVAGVGGAFGGFEQMEALGAAEMLEKENFALMIGANP